MVTLNTSSYLKLLHHSNLATVQAYVKSNGFFQLAENTANFHTISSSVICFPKLISFIEVNWPDSGVREPWVNGKWFGRKKLADKTEQ